jgi:hypothetical protein
MTLGLVLFLYTKREVGPDQIKSITMQNQIRFAQFFAAVYLVLEVANFFCEK